MKIPEKDDSISRADAIEAVKHSTAYMHDDLYEAISIRIPSADRATGKWIRHENPKLGICMKVLYECSVCGEWLGCEYFVRKSFCPNCGADMRKGGDTE